MSSKTPNPHEGITGGQNLLGSADIDVKIAQAEQNGFFFSVSEIWWVTNPSFWLSATFVLFIIHLVHTMRQNPQKKQHWQHINFSIKSIAWGALWMCVGTHVLFLFDLLPKTEQITWDPTMSTLIGVLIFAIISGITASFLWKKHTTQTDENIPKP